MFTPQPGGSGIAWNSDDCCGENAVALVGQHSNPEDPLASAEPAQANRVELRRIELLTSSMPWKRSTN
jgi:hypothetical protein